MKLSRYFLIALIATSLFSCKKNSDKKDCSLSEANLVGTYKISTAKYKASASTPEIDAIATGMIDACELDDLLNFKADHTVIYTDAGVKCDDPGDFTSTWSLSGTTLIIDGGPNTIASFDCSGFSIKQPGNYQEGDLTTITVKKQ